uniref:Retrotransposon Copia-like N-terminal domain-containing protein n=1 Tax=Cajanus cajan TaxID=3821 RepID=A0A151RGB5_CAJCA|nr:hypothetical protein KK1_037035 [Cajanus cajan]
MMMALKTKNKLCFVDGTLPQPKQGDQNYKVRDRCNTLVISWLYHLLDPEIAV